MLERGGGGGANQSILMSGLYFSDFKGRIKHFLIENQIAEGCIAKMFVIVPQTCTDEDSVEKAANQG